MIYLIAIIGAFVAGCINTLAGNGSAITLSILTQVIGLDGVIANATNRVGIASQSIIGSLVFAKEGQLNFQQSKFYILLTCLGAAGGIYTAVIISNEAFLLIFRFLLVFMFIVILVKPKRWLRATSEIRDLPLWISLPVFLGIGFYGGFIQMGMGIFFLAAMVLVARYNLVEGNAVKALVAAIYTTVAVGIFAWQGLIDWKIGGLMAVGQSAGGYITARFAATNPKANLVAYWVLVVVVLFAIALAFGLINISIPGK